MITGKTPALRPLSARKLKQSVRSAVLADVSLRRLILFHRRLCHLQPQLHHIQSITIGTVLVEVCDQRSDILFAEGILAKNGNQTDHTANTKKKKVNKDLVIRARVTAEQRELFEKKAEERGFSTVSEMIRSLIADTDNSGNTTE